MKYVMKAGTLYQGSKQLACIKGALTSPKKKICLADGSMTLLTDIHTLDTLSKKADDISFRQYVLLDTSETVCMLAKPAYAEGEEPAIAGWPICRMPRVDHAHLQYRKQEYCLRMRNSQNYTLTSASGATVVQIFHRGLCGGWDIEAEDPFSPAILCGIFAFCRYMEHENEFLIV